MANIVPGAIWQPVDVGNRAARRKGRGLVGHVAVSGSKNLAPGPLATRSADWHFYLPKDGPAIQYIDLDKQCWATGAGNASMVAFESEGGLGATAQVNAEPWTESQLNWAARILRHLHDTEGVPLQVMPDSRPASRGFGTHRLGINPWRVADGELWSSANAKACPGDAKHAQRAEIVRRAAAGATTGGTDMFDPTRDRKVIDETRYLMDFVKASTDQIPGLVAAINTLAEALAAGRDDLTAAELTDAVALGIQRAGAEIRAVEEAAKQVADSEA